MQITQEDMRLIVYNNIYPLYTKLEVYDKDGKIIDEVQGLITGGSASINADSDVRRTLSIDIVPCDKYHTLTISEDNLIWINRSARFYIGVKNQRTDEIIYYLQGNYYFTNTSCTYDATTNTLSISCGDFMTALDATKNGQIGGATNTVFYAYDELFMGSWYEEAKAADEKNVASAKALFEWASKMHPNDITKTENKDVQTAVFELMTESLDDDTQNKYINTIQSVYGGYICDVTKLKGYDGSQIPKNEDGTYTYTVTIKSNNDEQDYSGSSNLTYENRAGYLSEEVIGDMNIIYVNLPALFNLPNYAQPQTRLPYEVTSSDGTVAYNEISTNFPIFGSKDLYNRWINGDDIKPINNIRNNNTSPEIVTYQHIDDLKMLVSYNVIRDAVVDVIKAFTNVKNYIIDDIGEIKALPQYNKNWEAYREEHELWNTIPYDQEFTNGSSVLSILTAFRDLYPNYEVFFTEDNVLVFRMIPSFESDPITYDNQFLQDTIISESTTLDMTTVRNISEIFGKTLEVDFYTDKCTYADNIYTATIPAYDTSYYNGDIVGVKIPADNKAGAKLKIASTKKKIPIYDENKDKPIEEGQIKAGVQVFKIIKTYTKKKKTVTRAYYLGQWQPHALDVLTNGTELEETYTDQDGNTWNIFSEDYFKAKYNCNVVHLNKVPDSPFTVQKIGEILDSKSGGDYENISSDAIALEYAAHENYQNCRLMDTITITTKLIPFLDVNIKVEYKPYSSQVLQQYIIKSVNHDFDSWTSTITMNRFYSLYDWVETELPDDTNET